MYIAAAVYLGIIGICMYKSPSARAVTRSATRHEFFIIIIHRYLQQQIGLHIIIIIRR